ncbi:molybdenum ABC transporter, molybdate-binding protein [Polaromonas sp. OV174]|uniref:molybdate ABC transporter substrate-binding protein n=1 Tax=Polaromonas sp. OV174 TaxID=1855300 RepID=UPI0008DFB021|nr:molybdate ABC transporter substrate-binding protein [Polaromonas sp. OV174]SFB75362.1 molybdenum ABC transporter, molybdate-binding protein [Polaromonas sp. OV174]
MTQARTTQALLAVSMMALLAGGPAMVKAQTPVVAPLQVYAAGSLREPLTEIARLYEAATGSRAELVFGASGLLRERIEKGEPAQVFASADTQHPETLASKSPQWQKPTLFVRNRLCALTAPDETATPASLLERMLNPAVRLGTSTPKADPSGDYAWELFRRAESVQPGAYAALDAKALKLTGSPAAPQPPAGRGTYEWLMSEGRADILLTYCTNAISARKTLPRLKVVELPPALQVSAAYGLTARSGDAAATQFAQYLLSPPAQAVFVRLGFASP